MTEKIASTLNECTHDFKREVLLGMPTGDYKCQKCGLVTSKPSQVEKSPIKE